MTKPLRTSLDLKAVFVTTLMPTLLFYLGAADKEKVFETKLVQFRP